MEIIDRKFKPETQNYFLFGPRGTGKSTYLKKEYPDALYIDLLLPDEFRSYSAKPERLINIIDAYPDKKIVIIDEVQKIPDLLALIHSLIESKKNINFILTGSSARRLKHRGADFLAGRVPLYHLHPFTFDELGGYFNIEKALINGMVPVIWNSENAEAALKAYVDLYIREEVFMEGFTRNVGAFSRFLEAVSFSHASVMNISNIARECEVERKTVEGYISILEDIMLAFRVPVFIKKAKRAVSSHPKFYFFDCGVYRAVRPAGPLDTPEDIAGASMEGLIAQHLRAWIDYSNSDHRLFFWRTQAGNEVDFIVYGSRVFTAIEVKNSKIIRPDHLRGLKSFHADYPDAKKIIVYRGKSRVSFDYITAVPVEDFLLNGIGL